MVALLSPVPAPAAPAVRIKVVGVGGAGGNVVDRLAADRSAAIETIALNTDSQALEGSRAGRCIVLGENATRGMGAGGNPGVGHNAAEECNAAIYEALRGADLVFIAAGMGGGTGTGAAPYVASLARELGALTIAVVTRPFEFEGSRRAAVAEQGIAQLRSIADTVVVIPNDRLVQVSSRDTSMVDAFAKADNVLRLGVQGIADIMLRRGLINVDFADVRAVMGEAGPALLGIGVAQGNDRAVEAVRRAMACPLLEGRLDGARRLLFNITGGEDMGLHEVNRGAELLKNTVDPDANIIFGTAIDPGLKAGYVKVTLLATGFSDLPQTQRRIAESRPHAVVEAPEPQRAQPVAAPSPRPLAVAAQIADSLDIPPFLRRHRRAQQSDQKGAA
jgi:cell division protein FtsZ